MDQDRLISSGRSSRMWLGFAATVFSLLFLAGQAEAKKVEICHFPKGNPANVKRIKVGKKAVAKHIANHGDNLAGTEICGDQIDNDCDGLVDEIEDEVCDGIDNDCDQSIDEELELGECVAGEGTCEAEGDLSCVEGELICDAEPLEPSDEVCDGLDNDCDGETDNDPVDLVVCSLDGVGECLDEVTETCVEGPDPVRWRSRRRGPAGGSGGVLRKRARRRLRWLHRRRRRELPGVARPDRV